MVTTEFGHTKRVQETYAEQLATLRQNPSSNAAFDFVTIQNILRSRSKETTSNTSNDVITDKKKVESHLGLFNILGRKIHTAIGAIIENTTQVIKNRSESLKSLLTPKPKEEKGRNRWNIKNVVIPTSAALGTLGIVGMMMLGTAQLTNREAKNNQDQLPASPTAAVITPDKQSTTLMPTIEPYIPRVESPEHTKPNLPIIEPAETVNVYTSKSGDTVSDILFTHGYDPYGDALVQFIRMNAAPLQRFAIRFKSNVQLNAVVTILNEPNFLIDDTNRHIIFDATRFITPNEKFTLPQKLHS